jgi:hypothetical protein
VRVEGEILGVMLGCGMIVLDKVMPGLLLTSLIHRLGRISMIRFDKHVRNKHNAFYLPIHLTVDSIKFSYNTSTTMLTSHLRSFHFPSFIRAQITGKRLFSVGRIAWTDMKKYYSDPDYRRRNLDKKVQEQRLRKVKNPNFHSKLKSYLKEDSTSGRYGSMSGSEDQDGVEQTYPGRSTDQNC